MNGRIHTTPWGRAGIASLDGGFTALSQRVPEGHTLHVSARSSHGPWLVSLYRMSYEANPVFRTESRDLPGAIAQALEVVWP